MENFRIYLRPEGLMTDIPKHIRMCGTVKAETRVEACSAEALKQVQPEVNAVLKALDKDIKGKMEIFHVRAATGSTLEMTAIDLDDVDKATIDAKAVKEALTGRLEK